MTYSTDKLLPNPLPTVNVPYKECWGDMYDFYGNRVLKSSNQLRGGDYNWSVDNVYNAWNAFIMPFFEQHCIKGNEFKETEIADASLLIKQRYKGFDTNALVAMISDNPTYLLKTISDKKLRWVHNLYNIKLREFGDKHKVNVNTLPPNTLISMRNIFEDHSGQSGFGDSSFIISDWKYFFNYTVGVETKDKNVYEMKAFDLIDQWIIGNTMLDMAASNIIISSSIQSLISSKKIGIFTKIIDKYLVNRYRQKLSWYIYPMGYNKLKFPISDVTRFHPPLK